MLVRFLLAVLLVFSMTPQPLVNAHPRANEVFVKKENNFNELETKSTSSHKIAPLDSRSLKDWSLTQLLVVSDIDGNLHAIDRDTGSFLWSLPMEEPLVNVQAHTGSENAAEMSNLLWFVEPNQDGSLFYFSPTFGLNKLPTSIKDLVMQSPFSLSGDNKMYTGCRKTSLYRINIKTGEVSSHFGATHSECPIPNIYQDLEVDDLDDSFIMMGKTTYELSIYSTLDSSMVWNITFSEWGPNNIDSDLITQNSYSLDNLYFTPFYDRSLLAVNRYLGTPSWIARLPSLAVNVFDIFNNLDNRGEYAALPHPLKVLNELQNLPEDAGNLARQDLCFINKTASGHQWFAMSYSNYPALVKSAPMSPYQMAVNGFDNQKLSKAKIEIFRTFNVNEETAEEYVSGVHKVKTLDPSNQYQPVPNFEVSGNIDLGKSSVDSEDPGPTPAPYGPQNEVPNIMDGILFSDRNDDSRNILATVDVNRNGLSSQPNAYDNLPTRYYEPFVVDTRIESISMFRRVAEDLFVMSILVLFFFGSRKLNFWLRSRNSTKDVEELDSTDCQIEISVEPAEKLKDSPQQPEALDLGATLVEKETAAGKRVKIVAPDSLDPDNGASDDTETEEISTATKKKRKRGSRGGKRSGRSKKAASYGENDEDEDTKLSKSEDMKMSNSDEDEETASSIATKSLVKKMSKPSIQMKKLSIDNNLVISDRILGYGSHGTVVYQGTFENRPVAVKRMLLDFYDIANHEVRLLQESDDHPNVVRYFCSQSSEQEKFLYIALELCICTLEEIVEKPLQYQQKYRIPSIEYSTVLLQLVSGLHYLHSLKIVHRDLKPQNILVGDISNKDTKSKQVAVRLLISDFGLCKKLDADQSSFRPTNHHSASGTSGWRAPELLLLHDLHEISPQTISSIGSRHSTNEETTTVSAGGKRLTKAIDIFALGCVFFYVLSNGHHPFGDRYMREANIIKGEHQLLLIKKYCPNDFVEAQTLISSMINFNPSKRPDTEAILKHPYFWSSGKKLDFLLKVSDRFEVERRDPPSEILLALERISFQVHGGDWLGKFDEDFTDNLGKYRKYSTSRVMDLLRSLRNKYHHFNDMPPDLQQQMSPLPDGFYQYFNQKFPHLLMETYAVVANNLSDEHVFKEYF